MIALVSLALLVSGAVRALAPRDRAFRAAAAALAFGVWCSALGAGVLLQARTAVDLACALAGAALWLIPWRADAPQAAGRASWPMRALVLVNAAGAAAGFIATAHAFPDGGWDATMMWNLRARFFAGDPQPLQLVFDRALYHSGYPLLVSGGVARLWILFGERSSAPLALGAAFAAACALALWAFARKCASPAAACLAAALLLGAPLFARIAAWQYADVPLALWVLLAVAFSAYGAERGEPRAYAAAGLAAGLGAWTKNEGLLLFLCLAASVPLCAPRELRWRAMANFAAGALPLLALVAGFKLSPYPRTNYLFADQTRATALHKLADFGRWVEIAKAFAEQPFSPRRWGFGFWAVVPVLLLRLLRRGGAWTPVEKHSWTTAGLALLGYFPVYLITTWTLQLHLETSLDRLYLHIYPSALLAFAVGIARLNTP
jgi:hypothetical protein